MNLIYDSNILIWIARDKSNFLVENLVNPKELIVYISIVSMAEIQSIGVQSNWGTRKWQILESFLEKARIIDINENLIQPYVEIDTFSQKLNPNFETYPFETPRNMGKNDLWIAATAAFLNLTLVTTDKDFDHLSTDIISLNYINPNQIQNLFINPQ